VSELASRSQLQMSFIRWALVTVPLIMFIGFVMAFISNSGNDNRWYAALDKPYWTPPGWVFPVVWTSLYILLGLALAMILNARGARGRSVAISLFVAQMVLNYLWSPTFFAAHQVSAALGIIIFMLTLTIATTFAFARIRKVAAWMLVPYMVWLSLALLLNYQIDAANPDAETMVPPAASATIRL
jgi:translocator protein